MNVNRSFNYYRTWPKYMFLQIRNDVFICIYMVAWILLGIYDYPRNTCCFQKN